MVIKIWPHSGPGMVYGPEVEFVEIENGNVVIFFYNKALPVVVMADDIEMINIYP